MYIVCKGVMKKVSPDTKIEPHLLPSTNTYSSSMEKGIFFVPDLNPEPYRMPKRIFGDVYGRRDKIIKAWKSRGSNTAVLLSGTKGTGKTVLVKACVNYAIENKIPVVNFTNVIGDTPDAQLALLSRETGPVLLMVDEVEKVLRREEWQQRFLTFLDGTFDGQVLTIMTANETKTLDTNFFNRPGRILYNWKYHGLEKDVIRSVVEHNLDDKSLIDQTVRVISEMNEVTFDVVTAIVQEMNTFEVNVHDALKPMNVGTEERAGFMSM